MPEIGRFIGEDGSMMLVELDTAGILPEQKSDVDLVVKRGQTRVTEVTTRLEDSLRSVEGAAVALLSSVSAVRQQKEGVLDLIEVSLELSLSFGVEGGVIVAKGTATTQATATLTWRSRASE